MCEFHRYPQRLHPRLQSGHDADMQQDDDLVVDQDSINEDNFAVLHVCACISHPFRKIIVVIASVSVGFVKAIS